MNFLEGYKTYIVAGAMIVYVLLGYALGKPFDTDLLLQALAIIGLRSALTSHSAFLHKEISLSKKK